MIPDEALAAAAGAGRPRQMEIGPPRGEAHRWAAASSGLPLCLPPVFVRHTTADSLFTTGLCQTYHRWPTSLRASPYLFTTVTTATTAWLNVISATRYRDMFCSSGGIGGIRYEMVISSGGIGLSSGGK